MNSIYKFIPKLCLEVGYVSSNTSWIYLLRKFALSSLSWGDNNFIAVFMSKIWFLDEFRGLMENSSYFVDGEKHSQRIILS